MKKILFIVDHRLNRSPSQRYRFEQYLEYFKSNGFEWELSEIITEKDDSIFYKPGNYVKKVGIILKSFLIRFKDLRRAKHVDVVFIQREALLIGSSYFEKQLSKRSNVIFDFDDSIWLLDTSPENKKFDFLKNPNKTKINIQHAHTVIAGNAYLADYAKQFNKNTVIIPTTIDTNFHKPKPELRNKVFDSAQTDTLTIQPLPTNLYRKGLGRYFSFYLLHQFSQQLYLCSEPKLHIALLESHHARKARTSTLSPNQKYLHHHCIKPLSSHHPPHLIHQLLFPLLQLL